jgi:hypothetical protein
LKSRIKELEEEVKRLQADNEKNVRPHMSSTNASKRRQKSIKKE